MHENMKINAKGRVKWTYWLGERKTLQKYRRKTTKNWEKTFTESERERKVWKNFWKVSLNKSNSVFKKPNSRVSIDQNKQRLIKEFWNNFNWLKKSLDRSKFQKKTQFWKKKKTQFLHKILQVLKNMSKMHEYEMQSFSKTQVLNPFFPRLIFSNILHNFSSIKSILHKNSNYLQTWLVKPKTHTITCTMFSKE